MGTTTPAADPTNAASAQLPPVRSQITTTAWASALLVDLGAPLTTNNLNNVKSWMASEETASSWLTNNNPLNTTWGSKSSGIPSYASVIDGITATADTIKQGNGAFAGILNALKTNAPYPIFKQAVVASPWAAGHYGKGSAFSSTPLNAYATGTGSNPTGTLGQLGSDVTNAASTIAAPVTGLIKDATSLGGLISDVTNPAFWKRVGIFFFGVVFIGGGVVLFVNTSKAGQGVKQAATTAAAVAA